MGTKQQMNYGLLRHKLRSSQWRIPSSSLRGSVFYDRSNPENIKKILIFKYDWKRFFLFPILLFLAYEQLSNTLLFHRDDWSIFPWCNRLYVRPVVLARKSSLPSIFSDSLIEVAIIKTLLMNICIHYRQSNLFDNQLY